MRPVSDLSTEPSAPTQGHATGPSRTARTRRAVLAAGLGGLAATVAGALGRPGPAEAAAGGNLIIGSSTNSAGTSNTILTTTSTVVAFELLQKGAGTALMGYVTPTTGSTRGVYGRTDSTNGDGVQARNAGAAGTGAAMRAFGGNNDGLVASTDNSGRYAVSATHSNGGSAVYGDSSGGNGVFGSSTTGSGINGFSSSSFGVYGESTSSYGVYGYSSENIGVFGESSGTGVYGVGGTYGGYFDGDIVSTGTLYAASASAAVKNFRIDHPQNPAEKILMHSCVESNERLTVYAGTVRTDAAGEATISLPGYFEALNRDLRYQLTVIGADVRAWVQTEVKGNRFTIATSGPGAKVCWQVTGVRADAYAKAHPLVVESAKAGREEGRYLHPVEHGQPENAGVDYELRRKAKVRPAEKRPLSAP